MLAVLRHTLRQHHLGQARRFETKRPWQLRLPLPKSSLGLSIEKRAARSHKAAAETVPQNALPRWHVPNFADKRVLESLTGENLEVRQQLERLRPGDSTKPGDVLRRYVDQGKVSYEILRLCVLAQYWQCGMWRCPDHKDTARIALDLIWKGGDFRLPLICQNDMLRDSLTHLAVLEGLDHPLIRSLCIDIPGHKKPKENWRGLLLRSVVEAQLDLSAGSADKSLQTFFITLEAVHAARKEYRSQLKTHGTAERAPIQKLSLWPAFVSLKSSLMMDTFINTDPLLFGRFFGLFRRGFVRRKGSAIQRKFDYASSQLSHPIRPTEADAIDFLNVIHVLEMMDPWNTSFTMHFRFTSFVDFTESVTIRNGNHKAVNWITEHFPAQTFQYEEQFQ